MNEFERALEQVKNGEKVTCYGCETSEEKHLLALVNKSGLKGFNYPRSKKEELLQLLAVAVQNDDVNINKLLVNLLAANEGVTYNEVINDEVAYQKSNPTGVLPYVRIDKVGGMSYKSENLLVLKDVGETTKNGITHSINDGVVTINGKPTATYTSIISQSIYNLLEDGKTYTLRCNEVSTNPNMFAQINIVKNDNSREYYNLRDKCSIEFTVNKSTQKDAIFLIQSGAELVEVSNLTITPEIVLGNGITHSKVTSMKSFGRNLFDTSEVELKTGDISISNITDTSITINTNENYKGNGFTTTNKFLKELTSNLEVGKTYIINADTQSSQKMVYLSHPTNENYSKLINFGQPFILTKENLDSYVCLYGLDQRAGYGYGDCVISNIQINEFADNLVIPEEVQALEGYGMGVDSNYYNYIDFNTKKHIQVVKKIVLTNDDIFDIIDSTTQALTYLRVYKPLDFKGYNNFNAAAFITDKFTKIHDGQFDSETHIGTICTNASSYMLYIGFPKGTTLEEAKAQAVGTTLIYELATPIETDISAYISDNYIKAVEGGTITFENVNSNAVPSEVTYCSQETSSYILGDATVKQTSSDIIKDVIYHFISNEKTGIFIVNEAYILKSFYTESAGVKYYTVNMWSFFGSYITSNPSGIGISKESLTDIEAITYGSYNIRSLQAKVNELETKVNSL